MSDAVRTEESDGLLHITLDRPPLNVLTTAMLERLAEVFAKAVGSTEIRVIRLDAVGKAFSAGVDVGDHEGEKVQTMMAALERLFVTLEQVRAPIVSVVQGAALGGGCELILGTDLCLAARSAKFGQPEIRLGLFAPPATVLLPRLVGERVATDLLLTGRTLSADEARELGLVSRVVEDAELEGETKALIDTLLGYSGAALGHAKEAIRLSRGGSTAEAHTRINELYLEELMNTEDAHEGLRAFMEKRAAVWSHR